MTPKVPDPPPPDPTLVAQQQRAAADSTAAIQDRLTMDTSSVMARYGSRLALAGGMAPATAPAAVSALAAPSLLPTAIAKA
jgi:hypothetical protein